MTTTRFVRLIAIVSLLSLLAVVANFPSLASAASSRAPFPTARSASGQDVRSTRQAGAITPDPSLAPEPIATIVDRALAGHNGTYGVAVSNLKTGETAMRRGLDFFPSASLYKLDVMYEVFRQQHLGLLSFDETLTIEPGDMADATDEEVLAVGNQVTIQKALELMIDVSSNAAAHALGDRVGWDGINASMSELGLAQTRLSVGAWKLQVSDWRSELACTSPADMQEFFDALYHHQLVSPTASDQMLRLLLAQKINDRLPAELPPGTAVAHKTGNLPGVVNDAGIVYGPRADFILIVMTSDADDGIAAATEADLARALYDRFELAQ